MASPAAKGTPELRTVVNELSEVEHKAYKIGIQLGIPHNKMEMFKNEDNVLTNVVNYWLSGNVEDVPATWESLVTALQSKSVGETGLAKTIATKFCNKDQEDDEDSGSSALSDEEALSPDVKKDLEQQLNLNLKIIKRQYADYLDRILTIVQEKGVTTERLRFYLLSLSASTDDSKKLKLLSDMNTELNEAKSITKIFTILCLKYASFLDYSIFETILKRFGEKEKHEDLNYPTYLKNYIKMHKIQEFVKLNPKLQQKLDSQSEFVEIKFNITKTQSLSNLNEVIAAVANILDIQASALRLYNVKKGCVLVTLMIHTSIADAIFNTRFSEDQNEKLRKASVLWLKYKGLMFDFHKPADDLVKSTIPLPFMATTPPHTAAKSPTTLFLTVAKSATTPLHTTGLVESVRKKLIKLYQASINSESITTTPLHKAVESGNIESVRKLLEFEPEVTLTTAQSYVEELCQSQREHTESRSQTTNVTMTRPNEVNEETKLLELEEETKLLETTRLLEQSINPVDVHLDSKKIIQTESHELERMEQNYPLRRQHVYKRVAQTFLQETESDTQVTLSREQSVNIESHKLRKFPLSSGVSLFKRIPEVTQTTHHTATELSKVRKQPHEPTKLLRQRLSKHRFPFKKSPEVTQTTHHTGTELSKVREQPLYGVNSTDSLGWTPLHYACATGNFDMVRVLVSEFKANVTAEDVSGRTPVFLAAIAGHDIVVQVILSQYRCLANTKDNNDHPLIHYACAGGNFQIVRSLIHEYGIDANMRNCQNNTPLHVAALCGQDDVAINLIKEFGCDTKARGWIGRSLLHKACAGGSVNLVRTLISDHKANVNARDSQNNTPLHVAVLCGNDEVALTLIAEFKCDPNVRGRKGDYLLHKACMREDSSLMRTLIHEYNVDINAKNDYGNTPVHVAALHGNEKMVLTLIYDFKCDTEVRGWIGRSLLHMACVGGNINLVRTLIQEHIADINARDDDNNTPIHVAALADKEEVVVTLINEFGCDAMSRGYRGQTLLHKACKSGGVSLIKTLIHDHNVDTNTKDNRNCTPMQLALLEGRTGVAEILKTATGKQQV